MKQKIKKLTYKIPLKSTLINGGEISVSAFEIPGAENKKCGVVSIKVSVKDNISDIPQGEQSVVIPKKQIKKLCKALKKVSKS